MKHDISPGLASLVIQTQVFFTIGLAMTFTRERVALLQWAALALAGAGLAEIVLNTDASATPLGLALTLLAAFCWAGGNIVARATKIENMLAFIVWSSLFAVPPLFLGAFVFEGWPAIAHGVESADAPTWGAVLWQSVGNTMFGYGVWGWLLLRYPAATVTPWALLVPIFGMGASALWDHEAMPAWKLIAAALVMSGLALNLLAPRLRLARKPAAP
jgi:O-acetylserine/cysteine efflux transporter